MRRRPRQRPGVDRSRTTPTAPMFRRRARRGSGGSVHVVVGLPRLAVIGAGRLRGVPRAGQRG